MVYHHARNNQETAEILGTPCHWLVLLDSHSLLGRKSSFTKKDQEAKTRKKGCEQVGSDGS